MAVGIEKIKAALVDLEQLAETMSVVMEDGQITFGDITSAPALLGDLYRLFLDGKAALDAGEFADLDIAEVQELLKKLFELGSKIASKVKAA